MFHKKIALIPALIVLTLALQLMLPVTALADDGTPPPDPAAETTGTQPSDPATPTTDPAAATVPEILAQVPPDTDIAVVNADGSLEPLVTQAASDAIASSDPIWCPSTATGPTDLACTPAQATITALVGYLGSNAATYSGDGTIYFTTNYSTNDVYLSGSDANLSALHALSIVGNTGAGAAANLTVPVFINGWQYNVAVSNLNIDLRSFGYSSTGLDVTGTGSIAVINVNVTGSDFEGAYLDNDLGSGNVNVANSSFTNNSSTGLYVISDGPVMLNNVNASNNTSGDGAVVYHGGAVFQNSVDPSSNTSENAVVQSPGSSVAVANSTFNNNAYYGLYVNNDTSPILESPATDGFLVSSGDIVVANVTASGNQYGAVLEAGVGDITVTNSTFNNNISPDPAYYGDGLGLEALTLQGNIYLDGVTATGNDVGAQAASLQGNVDITDSTFSSNNFDGLEAGTMDGSLTLTDVNANWNGNPDVVRNINAGDGILGYAGTGALLASMNGPITVQSSTPGLSTSMFTDNGIDGLQIMAMDGGVVNLNDLTANINGSIGAHISRFSPCSTIFVTQSAGNGIASGSGVMVNVSGGTYSLNSSFGIYAEVGPSGQLNFDPSNETKFLPGNGPFPWSPINNSLIDTTDYYPCPTPDQPTPQERPYQIVAVPETGATPVDQDCDNFAGTIMVLPGEHKVTINCPAHGSMLLNTLTQSGLPGGIPQGVSFLYGYDFGLTDGGQSVKVLPSGSLTVMFKLPTPVSAGDHFGILYWDPTASGGTGGWVELPEFGALPDGNPLSFALHPDASPADGMTILSGVHTFEDFIKATVNFTGTFALIKR